MMDKCHHPLLHPFLPTTTTTSILHRRKVDHGGSSILNHDSEVVSSTLCGFVFRFALVISFGMISIWANHEASKGHTITIVNEANGTAQGHLFDLFYGSNGKASRMVYETSKFVENFLYPNSSYVKKQVNHVVLRLSSRNMLQSQSVAVVVESTRAAEEYVIYVNSSVMDESNHGRAMLLAVQKGVAGMWLWDGEGEVPRSLVNGIVECIISSTSSELGVAGIKSPEEMLAPRPPDCWKDNNAKAVADFLNYYERKRPGFIRRLNQELRSRWREQTVDAALGLSSQDLCVLHNSSIISSA